MKGIWEQIRDGGNIINFSEEMEKIKKMTMKELSNWFAEKLQEIYDNQYGKNAK